MGCSTPALTIARAAAAITAPVGAETFPDSSVRHLGPQQAVFDAMLAEFGRQQASRGLAVATLPDGVLCVGLLDVTGGGVTPSPVPAAAESSRERAAELPAVVRSVPAASPAMRSREVQLPSSAMLR